MLASSHKSLRRKSLRRKSRGRKGRKSSHQNMSSVMKELKKRGKRGYNLKRRRGGRASDLQEIVVSRV